MLGADLFAVKGIIAIDAIAILADIAIFTRDVLIGLMNIDTKLMNWNVLSIAGALC